MDIDVLRVEDEGSLVLGLGPHRVALEDAKLLWALTCCRSSVRTARNSASAPNASPLVARRQLR